MLTLYVESPIQISKLNDFIFCPYSIYLHSIFESIDDSNYHSTYQTKGRLDHSNIDTNKYSTSKRFLQGIPVYSGKLNLIGKIDIYDKEEKALIERKSKIVKIYEGYILQLHAQYLCLTEMGYKVDKLVFHSLKDNKRHKIGIPNKQDIENLQRIIDEINTFTTLKKSITPNTAKCSKCIYNPLCEYADTPRS